MLTEDDTKYLRDTFKLAQFAAAEGNPPFGAIIVGGAQSLIQAFNTVKSDSDSTCHAEMNTLRLMLNSGGFSKGATLYASSEPCPKCAGAIYWR